MKITATEKIARSSFGRVVTAVSLALIFTAPTFSQKEAPVVSCESLAKLDLPEVKITMAQPVAAGQFKEPSSDGPGGPGGPSAAGGSPAAGPRMGGASGGMTGPFPDADKSSLPAFCRVVATLKPSGDSNIQLELWLPLTNWNGKFMGSGNWGWAGSVRYDGLSLGIKNGYAVESNDTGHTNADGQNGDFAIGHPDKVIDYGWRANHVSTLISKAIAKAYYGTGPKHSYWLGCSLGGQQGMTEIQRFPQDYDGAVIGQPAWPIINLNAAQIWPTLLHRQNPAGVMSAAKSTMVQEVIKKQCATPVDLELGYLEDPPSCKFDPQTLLCKDADAPDCLSQPQIDMLVTQHNGLKNPRTGQPITYPTDGWGGGSGFTTAAASSGPAAGGAGPGGPGSGAGGPGGAASGSAPREEQPMGVATGLFKNLVFQDPNWDWKTLDMDKDLAFAEKVLATVNTANNPNLKPFFDHGGKLILYEIGPDTLNYYKQVLKTVGPAANNSIRAFYMQGMAHCGGGVGCDTFDKLGVIDQWVEGGPAPDRITAVKSSDAKVTHPICAYPMIAKYKGTGDVKSAESFVCAER